MLFLCTSKKPASIRLYLRIFGAWPGCCTVRMQEGYDFAGNEGDGNGILASKWWAMGCPYEVNPDAKTATEIGLVDQDAEEQTYRAVEALRSTVPALCSWPIYRNGALQFLVVPIHHSRETRPPAADEFFGNFLGQRAVKVLAEFLDCLSEYRLALVNRGAQAWLPLGTLYYAKISVGLTRSEKCGSSMDCVFTSNSS